MVMAQIVMVGEGMLELSRAGVDVPTWRLGHGGDTLNTAIHLARFGERVEFLTALGDDPFSAQLRADWQAEGIGTALTMELPGMHCGLYAVTTDEFGERTFTYWRKGSAASRMFSSPAIHPALAEAAGADLLGFSLISLAILPESGREALLSLAQLVRDMGGQVAFDGNYRARLWSDPAEARALRDRAIATCTIGLPTAHDEALLGHEETAKEVAARWRAGGAEEVVVKLGDKGALVDGRIVPPPERLSPRDTSGAGDSFNAGYLHARLAGRSPDEAALAGHRLAGWVVMRSGAVPPSDGEAPYAY